jgi:hypothetical protein
MWRLRLLRRSDLLAIAVALAAVGGFVLMAMNGQWRLLPNFGFGPDWHCQYVGKGDPICIKDPPKPN